jgi:hypothetical protein
MRRFVLIINGFTAIFFAAFLLYTFAGRAHINHMAREFVTVKTQRYADPAVETAENTLRIRIVRTILREERIAAFESEIAVYRQDPQRYISELTGRLPTMPSAAPDNPLVAKVTQWKENVRKHYDKVLGRLLWDLRIFAFSNMAAALFAIMLATRVKAKDSSKLVWVSFLLFAAIVYSVYGYIDRFSFFRILFNSYLGWWYPAVLALTLLVLYLNYGRANDRDAESIQT